MGNLFPKDSAAATNCLIYFFTFPVLFILLPACEAIQDGKHQKKFPLVSLSNDFRIEKVVGGLTYPTALAWDDQGRMYVSEAGGGLQPETLVPIRILR
jgi:hypothetical protein